MDAGLAPRRLRALAGDGRAGLGQGRLPARSTTRTATTTPRRRRRRPKSLDEVDPDLLAHLREARHPAARAGGAAGPAGGERRAGYAVSTRCSTASRVVTTFKKELAQVGVIFCSMSEAIREHPELVKKYLGSVVPVSDNYFACLNAAVFSDGSFVYVPPGVRCPMELSTYFRINAAQFRPVRAHPDHRRQGRLRLATWRAAPRRCATRTSCTPPWSSWSRWTTPRSNIPRSRTGIRATPRPARAASTTSSPSAPTAAATAPRSRWTQVETGSAITWKYPSCILRGESSRGEFYSIAITNGRQQADTGTKMIHLGANTRSRIISKGITAGHSHNTYRGLVSAHPEAKGARNFTQCDCLLIGKHCAAHTVPYIEARNGQAEFEHEATTTRLSEDQLFYCRSAGSRRRRRPPCWSTASSRTCCRNCRWSSPSRRRS